MGAVIRRRARRARSERRRCRRGRGLARRGRRHLQRRASRHRRAHLALDPDAERAGTATIVLGYPEALAMARGALDPAEALAAGRVRVRGDLAALVAGQDVLAAAAAQLGATLDGLTDPGV